MAMNDSSNEHPLPSAIEKKVYEKPSFRYEQVFVTSALSCSKNSTQSNCQLNPPASAS